LTVSDAMLDEWKLIWHHKFYSFALIIPIIFTFYFGFIYSHEKIEHIPIRYLDEDRSQISQQIIQAFAANEAFQVVGAAHSEQELLDDVMDGRVSMGVVIPPDFSESLKQGEQGKFLAVVDGSNLAIANTALTNASVIAKTFSIGISRKRVEAKGVADSSIESIRYGYRILFNPGMSYLFFVPLGVLGVLLQNAALTAIALWIVREKAIGRWKSYFRYWRTPWKVFYARSFPYFLIIMLAVVCTTGVLKNVFQVPFIGDVTLLFLLSAMFIASVMGVASLVAMFINKLARVLQMVMLSSLPSFVLSGFSFPPLFMPDWVAALSKLLPVSHFLHGLTEIAIKGNGWEQIAADMASLAAIFLVTSLTSMTMFSIQGRKHIREHMASESGT
jgi:ABC-2 type transport system permease protein